MFVRSSFRPIVIQYSVLSCSMFILHFFTLLEENCEINNKYVVLIEVAYCTVLTVLLLQHYRFTFT